MSLRHARAFGTATTAARKKVYVIGVGMTKFEKPGKVRGLGQSAAGAACVDAL